MASILPRRWLYLEPLEADNRWPFINTGLGGALNICVHEIVELGEYRMWPFWWDTMFPGHDVPSAVPLPLCQSPEKKGQIFNRGGPPCQGNPGCNKGQILQRLVQFISMRSSSPLAGGWELHVPVLQWSLHLWVAVIETLQQRLGKNKSPSQVLAGSSEINCFSFMFCRK